jgi:hypothetical protein
MIKLITIILFLVGCSQTSPKVDKQVKKKNTTEIKQTIMAPLPEYRYYNNNGRCWSGKETLNCKLKKAHDLIDKFNNSLMGLTGAVGGCCNNNY